MDGYCFVLVDGLTKSVSSGASGEVIKELVQEWYPGSHYHSYDPFEGIEQMQPGHDILEDRGRSLLRDLADCPDCCADYHGCQDPRRFPFSGRPIIFMGHDLGGSVIKRALILASEDLLFRRIAKATTAIFFFGALHRAPQIDPWEAQIVRLLAISERDVRTVFPSLQVLPAALISISQSFISISGSYALFNVYEKAGTTISKYSATLDVRMAENCGARRSHAELLSLKADDATADWVVQKLGSLSDEITSTNGDYHRFLRYLNELDPLLHQLETRLSSPGSLDWITKLDSYQTWKSAAGISFLHVYGPPGSGATVLTSNLVWILSDARPDVEMCYLSFSFNRQDILALSAEKMLMSLIRQLLSRQPRLFQHMRCLCAWIIQKRCVNGEILWILFELVLRHIGKVPVLLVVRTIQECSSQGGANAIVDRLLSLRRIRDLDLKIIITSQRADWAQQYATDFHSVAMKEVRSMDSIFRGLVRLRVRRLVRTRPAWIELDEEITQSLWVPTPNYYVAMAKVQVLEAEAPSTLSTQTAILTRVRAYPASEDEFFHHMVRRIEYQSYGWLHEALRWVVSALRPLTSQELAVAVAFCQNVREPGSEMSFQELEATILSDLPGDINRVAGFWVKVSGGVVEVTNEALKSFFVTKLLQTESCMQIQVLEKCLEYLCWARRNLAASGTTVAAAFEPSADADLAACELLEYAALYWPFHCRKAGQLDGGALDMVQNFLEDPDNLRFWADIVRYCRPASLVFDYAASPLKTSATFGLVPLVERFLAKISFGEETEKELNLLGEAADLSIEQGHMELARRLCQRLLDSGAPPRLHRLAQMGWSGMLRQFLKINSMKGFIDGQDTYEYTPLTYAAQFGHREAVEVLLEFGADPRISVRDKSTALHAVSKIGQVDIARLLTSHNADHRARNEAGRTPLELAAEGGFDDLVGFLLSLDGEGGKVAGLGPSTTALHLAAKYGHTSTCAYLLEDGGTVDARDENGQTPIHLAAIGGFAETLKILLNAAKAQPGVPQGRDGDEQGPASITHMADAAISDPENGGPSPLQLAAGNGFVDIMQLLMEYSYFSVDFTHDRNEALCRAATTGHWKPLHTLLQHTATRNPTDSVGSTALHVATRHNHVKLVRKLLESGKYDAEFRDEHGLAAIHIAAIEGHVDVATVLVQESSAVDCTSSTGDKPIHFAAKMGHRQVVAVLQKSKDLSTEADHEGKTPALLAAMAGHAAVVEELLSGFEDTVLRAELLWKDSFPLHKAVSEGNEELARILIQHGYQVDFINTKGDAPLHAAVSQEAITMIKFLLESGANPKTTNAQGQTPLSLAAKINVMMCQAILDAAPDSVTEYIDLPDSNNKTALYDACDRTDKEAVRLLLSRGADPNRRCAEGWTPLHASAFLDDTEILEMLWKAGADLGIRNDYESTAIILAAEKGRADAVRFLLDKGADPAVINSTGSSALHRAAQGGYLECVKLLVGAGAEVDGRKRNGITPLHLAIGNTHDAVAEYLITKGAGVNIDSRIAGKPLAIAMWNVSEARDMALKLVEAGATTTLEQDQWTFFPESTLIFALEHPGAISFDSPGRVLQHALASHYAIASSMLIESSQDLDEQGGPYCTALQAAAASGSVDLMEKMLAKKANPNIAGGKYGSALNAAITNENASAAELLLQSGADPNVVQGDSLPILRAIKQGSMAIVQTLLDHGADSTVRDENGRTLLPFAMHYGSDEVVNHLLSRSDISIGGQDLCERTPLMTAVMLGKLGIVEKLLEKGADPNVGDSERKTPLIRAVTSWKPDEAILTALLKHGADPLQKDCRGRGLLYWACLQGRHELIAGAILPAICARGELSFCGELAFHAAASLTSATSSESQHLILELLLSADGKLDLGEKDRDGWTALYTATQFGLSKVEESLAQAMILHGYARRPGSLVGPTAWHREDKAPILDVSEDGRTVKVMEAPVDPDGTRQPRVAIRADHCMPANDVYYFEVKIDHDAHKRILGVGFCEEQAPLNRMLGWDPGSWGYYGDDGNTFTYFVSTQGYKFGNQYQMGSTVGCGVNFEKQSAFFTIDGRLIGPAFRGIRGKLYPAVCFDARRPGASVTANFGSEPFKYEDWRSEHNVLEQSPKMSNPDSPSFRPATPEEDVGFNEDSDLEWEIERVS